MLLLAVVGVAVVILLLLLLLLHCCPWSKLALVVVARSGKPIIVYLYYMYC